VRPADDVRLWLVSLRSGTRDALYRRLLGARTHGRLSLVAIALIAACNTKGDENRKQEAVAPAPGPQPVFPVAPPLASPPPPISGGTLTVAPDGRTAVAADPDRDAVYVVDLPGRSVLHTVSLAAGSEPGRVAIDAHGRAHVVLRALGSVASIDLATGAPSETHVCVAPRGIAYDENLDALHVACAEGFLVTVPLSGDPPRALRRIGLDRDLRDVMLTNDQILVSRFRAADVIRLSRAGVVEGTATTRGGNLGWRMVAPPSQAATPSEPVLVSQDPVNPVGPSPAGYYGAGAADACAAPTITATRLDIPGQPTIRVPPAVLPVDLATNGREYVIVAAGNGHTPSLPQLFVHHATPPSPSDLATAPPSSVGKNRECEAMSKGFVPGQAIAAAFDSADELVVQSREPAALYIMTPDRQHVWKEIHLSDTSREDTGHAIFHSNSGGFLACASCHAEGGEDGRTWMLLEGARRTPSMRGTLAGTAPFHWDGQIANVPMLVDHVFVTRMSGPKIDGKQTDALQTWLFALPPPPKLERPADSVERGAVLFRERGCTSCHSGPWLTNNETHDVGTGGAFQVPSLVGVGWRAPFLHDGCARTLKDRFSPACGGDRHGDSAGLTPNEIGDLTAYLETL
jgi:hypothetical protein